MDFVNLSYYFWDDFIQFKDLLNISSFKMSLSTLWTWSWTCTLLWTDHPLGWTCPLMDLWF